MNILNTSAMTPKPGLVIALILAYEDYLRQIEGPDAVEDAHERPIEEVFMEVKVGDHLQSPEKVKEDPID